MEFEVKSEKKNELELELKGEDHTFSSLLVHQLLQDKDVDIAQYNIPHPLIGHPIFYVKTKQGKPRNAVKKALKEIKKQISEIKK